MSIAALSSAGFSQLVASTSNITASQQALQSLQQALASGNLSAAQTAFTTYQALNQNLANSGGSGSSNKQLSTDLTTLGSAISSGDLAGARTAFASVQNDLKTGKSPAVAAALAAVSQTVTEVQDLLSIFNTSGTSSSTTTDPLAQILSTAYGQGNGTAGTSNAADPTRALLESQYGAQYGGSSTSGSGSNGGGGVNVYA